MNLYRTPNRNLMNSTGIYLCHSDPINIRMWLAHKHNRRTESKITMLENYTESWKGKKCFWFTLE